MNELSSIFSITLAITLVLSGAGKLLSIQSTSKLIRQLRIMPKSFTPLISVLLPIIELLLGTALLLGIETRGTAAAVLLLMAAFGFVNWKAMKEGQNLECNCFGRLMPGTLGKANLLYNGLLAGFALWVAVKAEDSPAAMFQDYELETSLLFITLSCLLFAATILVRSRFAPRSKGLLSGTHIPNLLLETSTGGTVPLHQVVEAHAHTLLCVVHLGCKHCEKLIPLAGQRNIANPSVAVLLLIVGDDHSSRTLVERTQTSLPYYTISKTSAQSELQIARVPYGILVAENHEIQKADYFRIGKINQWFVTK